MLNSISIVIPSYNGKLLLEKNLPAVIYSLRRLERPGPAKQGQAFIDSEIIVVDDASSDSTEKWLTAEYPEVKLIKNKNNLRFARSCNRGVNAAKGEIVVLLNNDVSPSPDFLSYVIPHFGDEKVFAVGFGEINSVDGKIIHGGRGVSKFERGLVMHWRPIDQKSPVVTWLSGGSMAFNKSIWERLGGFDELFRPAYEEDRDLCWQALKSGYKIVFEQKAVVEHFHESTNLKLFGKTKISMYSLKNQLLFVWKNISSPKYLLSHLIWFPYHLILTTIRTKGIFLAAFCWALTQLPETLISRKSASKLWRIDDEEIFKLAEK
ncbi:glycosyltransferase family 2 protein [Candidatus Collierbacteria bacterium]|nr:glycosyltransferase family 2 protein [Candidatus Collierbacteria bacterium]